MGRDNVRYAAPSQEQDKVSDGLLKLTESYALKSMFTRLHFRAPGFSSFVGLGPRTISSLYVPMLWIEVETFYENRFAGHYRFAESGHNPPGDEWEVIDSLGKVVTAGGIGSEHKHTWSSKIVQIHEHFDLDKRTEMAYRRTLVYTDR